MNTTRLLQIINVSGLAGGLAVATLLLAHTAGYCVLHRSASAATAPAAAASEPEAVDSCCPEPDAAPDDPSPQVQAKLEVEVDTCCPVGAAPEAADPTAPWCGEHNLAEADCAICQPQRTALLQPGEGLKLRLPAADALERAGVVLGRAHAAASGREEVHRARISFNEALMAHVTPRTAGYIEEVLVTLGDHVAAGAALARLNAPELTEAISALRLAQSEEAQALEVFKREQYLISKEATSRHDYLTAEAALHQARLRTELARKQRDGLGLRGESAGSVLLRAPLSGVIVEKHAVAGENVERGETLVVVADTSTIWIEIAVPAAAAPRLQLGDSISARVEGLEGLVLEGTVDWVDARVDAQSRTVRARAAVANPGGVLKDGMTAEVYLARESLPGALLVPSDALQEYEGKPYLFVRLEPDLYEVRQVALGRRDAGRVAITAGLSGDEEIVLARSFTAKSEFLKARLGAGCADH